MKFVMLVYITSTSADVDAGGVGGVAEAPGGMHKAIKFVFGDMDSISGDCKGAEQEFRSLNRVKTIRHPFLLSLERIEVIDGQLLIVMELADRNLFHRFSEAVDSGLQGIPRAELLRYMEEAAEALDLMNLHHQIQHLDIKPQNLFLVGRHIKVADFGLAKDLEGARADMTGGLTPMYAPPETSDGWVSRQSDQYSLAIVYMEMLIGKTPFNGSTARQLILQHLSAVPDLAGLTSPDREAVAKALAKTPDDRFSSCTDFVKALLGEVRRPTIPREMKPLTFAEPLRPVMLSVAGNSTKRVLAPRKKSMPALITPRSREWRPASLSAVRKAPTAPVPSSRVTAPEEISGEGVLVPTLIVGLGGTGLAFLRATRQLIADRFGRSTLPHLRWLQIDTDPATRESAVSGSSETALESEDVLLATLRRPAHYLAHDGIPPVDTWLKQEDLFRIPRTPSTGGIRGIGRLALCDHYHVICHRIRTALEPLLNPSHLETANRITGLGVCSNVPRVVVATSLAGGTGSGMFLDCTYLIRRELKNLGCPSSRVSGLLGVPAWVSQTSTSSNTGNVRAALAELNHYHHAESCYAATFDTREGSITDPDRPFHRVTLIPLPGNCDCLESERSESLAAEVLFTELLAPIGRTIVTETNTESYRPFAVVGMQRLIWPRKAILRTAAALLAQRTLSTWSEKTTDSAGTHPSDLIEGQWQECQLGRESLRRVLEFHLETVLGHHPQDAVLRAFRPLTDTEAEESDLTAATLSFGKLVDLLGRPGLDENEHPPAIPDSLQSKVREFGSKADSRLANSVLALIEQPGLRLAGAEAAFRVLRDRVNQELAQVERDMLASEEAEATLFVLIHQQLIAPTSKSSIRGTQRILSLYEVLRGMRGWALARVQSQVLRACASVYRIILGRLPDYQRELTIIRNQLSGFLKQLQDGTPASKMEDGLSRPVFPDGTSSISESATRLLDGIQAEELREFENSLQGRVRHECRGVMDVCIRPKEHGAAFLHVLTDQSTRFLENRLAAPATSPILTALAKTNDMTTEDRIADLIDRATPGDLGQGKPTLTVIGIPTSAETAIDVVRSLCREEVLVEASDDDFVIWRECRRQSIHAFPKLCGEPGDDLGSGHSRSDVNWLPLS